MKPLPNLPGDGEITEEELRCHLRNSGFSLNISHHRDGSIKDISVDRIDDRFMVLSKEKIPVYVQGNEHVTEIVELVEGYLKTAKKLFLIKEVKELK